MALTLLRRQKTLKGGIKTRRLPAGWDNDYLFTILSA
jgi:hypothetical protein